MRALLIFVVWLMVGCSMKNMSPVDVADAFWEAQSTNNLQNAQKLVMPDQEQNVRIDKRIKIVGYRVDQPNITENGAVVPTLLRVDNPVNSSGKKSLYIPFNTYLVESGDGWKVDVDRTKRSLYLESTKLYSKELSTKILEKFRGFKEIFREIIDGLKY